MNKTLEQWQKELPDYLVHQGFVDETGLRWDAFEVFYDKEWHQIGWEDGHGPGFFSDCGYVSVIVLAKGGATFRRKKERQREFKIDLIRINGTHSHYRIDGQKDLVSSLLARENILSATLTVDERGGE